LAPDPVVLPNDFRQEREEGDDDAEEQPPGVNVIKLFSFVTVDEAQ